MTPQRKDRIEWVLARRQPDLTVVLENVYDPHNISAVMRSCDAVGIQEIYVLNTKMARHDKWDRRTTTGADKWLTVHQFENIQACFAAVRIKYNTVLTTHLASDATDLYELDLTQNIALVFGNEHAGVSDEVRAIADGNFIIPQQGMIRSLNISVACAVSLYEAYRQKAAAGHYKAPKIAASENAILRKQWGLYRE